MSEVDGFFSSLLKRRDREQGERDQKLEHREKGCADTPARNPGLALSLGPGLAGALAASPAAATPLTAQVKGLPAGLSVLMSFDLARCQGERRPVRAGRDRPAGGNHDHHLGAGYV